MSIPLKPDGKVHPSRLQVESKEGQAGAGTDYTVTQVPLPFPVLMSAKGKRSALWFPRHQEQQALHWKAAPFDK